MLKNPAAPRGLLAALIALFAACLTQQATSQDPTPAAPAPAPGGAPPAEALKVPGFVYVPAGQVWPGCTDKEYIDRARNEDLKKVLKYDIWGNYPAFPLPGFWIGRYEVTNAQWKHYLDKEFRRVHTTGKGETLKALAGRYVKFRGEPVESEWKAIYALNWRTLVDGWKNMQVRVKQAKKEGEQEEGKGEEKKEGEEEGKKEEGKKEEPEQLAPAWQAGWTIEDPPAAPGDNIGELMLPEGLKLFVYTTRVPQNWYGWCKISGLGVGREYCDPAKPAAEAFVVPDEEPFKSLPIPLKYKDFAAHPVRSVSPNEMLAFAEWAGCELPSEYEWERAARGDNLRWPYPFGPWNYNKQPTLISCAENERSREGGPMSVDDESVSGGDSPFGARHMSGNVWEQTRTFYDVHPRVTPEPPSPGELANYALVAKGGSYGDRWQLLWVCARTGIVGDEKCELGLQNNNRADSLGLRLVRHADRPGYDLLLHSIRRLCYDSASARWNEPYVPHAFAMDRMAGTDGVKLEDKGAPYIYAVDRARGTAFAPLWVTTLDDAARRANKPERNKYFVLGAFRSDVPLRAGVRLSDGAAKKLLEDRESYKKLLETWKKLPPAKQKNIPVPVPPADLEPDDFEKLTAKEMAVWGLWRENTVAPGEWFVVYWNGFIGLTNKTLTMPPDAIFTVPASKNIARKNAQPGPTQLSIDRDRVQLRFQVWEQPADKSKQVLPPAVQRSDEWALCEAVPSFFIKGGPLARPYCWEVDVAFKVAPADDPAWKGVVQDAATPGAETKPDQKAEKADGKAAADDKKPTGK